MGCTELIKYVETLIELILKFICIDYTRII